jgi:hypothetical protein
MILYGSEQPGECATVLVGSISAGHFEEPEATRFDAGFMSFRKRTGTYPVRNKNHAVVGALIGNGISLDISGDLSQALICIGYRLDLESTWKNEQKDYPDVDFAIANDELTTLLPVGITDNIGVIDGMICADVHPQISANYFPIIRASNWIDTPNNPFYPETIQVVSLNLTAMITTLDVHFSSLFFSRNVVWTV